MNYSLSAFSEPRGVMRILQFIFAICAFATTTNFIATVKVSCPPSPAVEYSFEYPFSIEQGICSVNTSTKLQNSSKTYPISANLSSDSQFFVATGVLSLMYCVFIIAVYAILDELYRSKNEIPLADFMLTTILAIFWLSGSAAWSNGATALKGVTDPDVLRANCKNCDFVVGSFSRLNISLIFGFLNFFLWASDLWFLYKETIWFQGRAAAQQQQAASGAGVSSGGVPGV
ncbi:unnamed protein product [Hermetia illucens]|uniref:MARVEL domain-containing protein n=1 Tax=Hermetia illucens TaxID=343691 RepID=A0A7R8V8D3_HERIL|nr:synaptophysin-like protein 2 [Hermetia illucens]CAD7094027.1 unnamed protein product [Hermetia illucens]